MPRNPYRMFQLVGYTENEYGKRNSRVLAVIQAESFDAAAEKLGTNVRSLRSINGEALLGGASAPMADAVNLARREISVSGAGPLRALSYDVRNEDVLGELSRFGQLLLVVTPIIE